MRRCFCPFFETARFSHLHRPARLSGLRTQPRNGSAASGEGFVHRDHCRSYGDAVRIVKIAIAALLRVAQFMMRLLVGV